MYWYIKHKTAGAVKIEFNGIDSTGWTVNGDAGLRKGVYHVTHFDKREDAFFALKLLRNYHTKVWGKQFKVIRVIVK